MECKKCGYAMIRASMYDPDGTVPLCGGVREDSEWWVCTNPTCNDGSKNLGVDVRE